MDDHDYFNATYFHRDDHQDYGHDGYHDSHRMLAPAGGVPTVDYAVIATVVLTLGLVLAIEVLRHQLDVAASGNPFFQSVLEGLYRECKFHDYDIVLCVLRADRCWVFIKT